MRASVIQLKRLFFERIQVESTEGVGAGEAVDFDFEGMAFRVSLKVGEAMPEGDESDSRSFVIALGVALDPEEEKSVPYKIDISAVGFIEMAQQVEKEKRRDLALVNGASLVYGAIRELVTTLTARCVAGPLVLPTADFRDHSEILAASPQAPSRPAH